MLKFLLFVLFSTNAQAQVLEAKPLQLMLETIFSQEFSFKEVALAFGYNSTKSCLYVSENMIVVKNYCSPKKPYPAKSYTVYSAKFGKIHLYQETIDQNLTKRDVRIETFPVPLAEQLKSNLNTYNMSELNKLAEKLQFGPACWSTNFSFYTESPEAKCNRDTVVDAENWMVETQELTADYKKWAELFERLDTKFQN